MKVFRPFGQQIGSCKAKPVYRRPLQRLFTPACIRTAVAELSLTLSWPAITNACCLPVASWHSAQMLAQQMLTDGLYRSLRRCIAVPREMGSEADLDGAGLILTLLINLSSLQHAPPGRPGLVDSCLTHLNPRQLLCLQCRLRLETLESVHRRGIEQRQAGRRRALPRV